MNIEAIEGKTVKTASITDDGEILAIIFTDGSIVEVTVRNRFDSEQRELELYYSKLTEG